MGNFYYKNLVEDENYNECEENNISIKESLISLDLNNEEVPKKKLYGWKRDLPDHRDIYYNKKLTENIEHKSIDLRMNCPEVYNQGELGSCTANSIAFLFEYDELKKKNETNSSFLKNSIENNLMPSRLFIYYNERKMEGTINYDSGANIRDGIKSVNKIGVCSEKLWKYDITKFKMKPSKLCYSQATKYKSIKYFRLSQNINDLKCCLIDGYPFSIGISIYESFESEDVSKTGLVPIPKKNEKLLGGHALAVVGYDDEKGFIVRNSWGNQWGLKGYCYIPYEYICNQDLANDFWTIRTITESL